MLIRYFYECSNREYLKDKIVAVFDLIDLNIMSEEEGKRMIASYLRTMRDDFN